jgi:hypothetical protein
LPAPLPRSTPIVPEHFTFRLNVPACPHQPTKTWTVKPQRTWVQPSCWNKRECTTVLVDDPSTANVHPTRRVSVEYRAVVNPRTRADTRFLPAADGELAIRLAKVCVQRGGEGYWVSPSDSERCSTTPSQPASQRQRRRGQSIIYGEGPARALAHTSDSAGFFNIFIVAEYGSACAAYYCSQV